MKRIKDYSMIILTIAFGLLQASSAVYAQNMIIENSPGMTNGSIAIRGINSGTNLGTEIETGVLGDSFGNGNGWNIGTRGFANGAGGAQIGVLGSSFANSNLFRLGVLGQVGSNTAAGTGTHRAVQGEIFGASNAAQRAAIAGIVISSGQNTATASGDIWAGYFDGDVCVLGTLFHNGISNPGNHLVSTTKKSKSSVLQHLNNIEVFDYTLKKTNEIKPGFDPSNVEVLFPTLVSTFDRYKHDSKTMELTDVQQVKGIDYNGMTAVLTKAIQEQQVIIDRLLSQSELLKQRIQSLELEIQKFK